MPVAAIPKVIEHLFSKELVRAAKKVLKPNGRLIITTPYHGYLKNLSPLLQEKSINISLLFGMGDI